MENRSQTYLLTVVAIVLMMGIISSDAQAQLKEPDVVESSSPKTPLTEGYHNEIGLDFMLNNFGFGIGGHYNRVLSDYTEFTFQTGITGIRDVSEQTFQSFFTGNRTIPNKYKRALGFPFLFGLEQRIFAKKIQDSFRLYIGGALGPALAFTYPYFDDIDGNKFRTTIFDPKTGRIMGREPKNDFFSGWGDGSMEWGYSGKLTIGADIGSSFGTRTKLEFGYFFYYFKQGLQIMEPFKPTEYQDGRPVEATKEKFFDAQQYFGSPQIKFTFGGMW